MPDGTCEVCGEYACDCGRCTGCDRVFRARSLNDDGECRACRPQRIIVTGGRDFDRRDIVFGVLGNAHRRHGIGLVIQGGAPGADRLARQWADFYRVPRETYKAEWRKYGNAAGPIRNERMATESKADQVHAFRGGAGTNDMVSRAIRHGIVVVDWQLDEAPVCYEDDER